MARWISINLQKKIEESKKSIIKQNSDDFDYAKHINELRKDVNEELKENIIAYRNLEIISKIEDIELCNRQLESLKVNLSKLCTE